MAMAPSSARGQSDLLQESQIVLQMPVVGNLAGTDCQDVRGDELDRLAPSLVLVEHSGEVTAEVQMGHDPVARQDLLRRWSRRLSGRGSSHAGLACGTAVEDRRAVA